MTVTRSIWSPGALVVGSILLASAVVVGLVVVGLGGRGDDREPDGSEGAAITGAGPSPETGASTPSDGTTDPGLDESAVPGLAAPRHVVASQGPVDLESRYVIVTWDHAERMASAYEIERDGDSVAEVPIDDDPWDDLAWTDGGVTAGSHVYRVRPLTDQGPGPWSEPVELIVWSAEDIGAVFRVDDYEGTDHRRAQQAVDDAEHAGGGLVAFGPRTYVFDRPLVVSGDGIRLQGAGADQTALVVGFANGTESCGPVAPLVQFRGQLRPLVGTALRGPITAGQSEIEIDGAHSLEPGDTIAVDATVGQRPTSFFAEQRITQDPGAGRDERNPWDANRVIAVDGSTVGFERPFARHLPASAEIQRYESGRGNGIERLTVQGPDAEDDEFHRLIHVVDQVGFRLADVTARWANRNLIDASGYDLQFVGLAGIEGGARSWQEEPCKYKVGLAAAADVVVVGAELGSLDHDRNMSLLTVQRANRIVVRHSSFGQSRTYGLNEHGGGSVGLVFENNRIATGPTGGAGILLGNSTWGFGADTAIRNNTFEGNAVDVLMVEHPYNVSISANRSTGCTDVCILWAGWGGARGDYTPIEDRDDWGSARLLIEGNTILDAENGIDLGADISAGYPYAGIRDAVLVENRVEAAANAVTIRGDAETTGRILAYGNRFDGAVERPEPAEDMVWLDDGGEPRPELPSWARTYMEWEL